MAVEAERLVISLEANIKQYLNEIKKLDKANKDLFRRMQSEIERSGSRNEALMARMGERMARGMSRGFKRGMGTLLAAAGVGGFINAAERAVRAVADLGDKAEDLGMRAANLQAWNRMMVEAGGSVESMGRALSEVAEQGQNAESHLAKLFAANKMQVTGDVQKDMMTLLEILDKAKSAPQALRALEYVFGGKLGRQLAEPLRGGREAFSDAFNKNMREGIALTEEQIKQARQLEESWNRLGLYFASRFSQIILDTFGSWEGFETAAKNAIDTVMVLIEKLLEAMRDLKSVLIVLADLWNKIPGTGYIGKIDLNKLWEALPGGAASTAPSGGANIKTSAAQSGRMKQAMAALSGRYDPTIAAAIIGNLMQESGLNPAAVGDSGASHGIAQWNRKAGRGFGMPGDFAGQLDYLMRDLEQNYPNVLRSMRGKSLEDATRMFMMGYEQPGDPQFQNRIGWARQASGIGGGAAGGGGIIMPVEDTEKKTKAVKELTAAERERNRVYDESESAINMLSRAYETQQENLQAQADQFAQVGDMIGGAVSGFVQDLMNGVDAGEAFSNMLKNLASQLMDMAIKQLFSGIFGGGGMGGGLFGGMLGGGAPAMAGAGAGMIRMGSGALKSGMGGSAVTIGGATINVAGNADTRTVAMMSKMIEVNNQQQSARLDREWGRRGARYKSLRSP